MTNNYKTPLTGPVASAEIVPELRTTAAQYQQLRDALNSGKLTARAVTFEYLGPPVNHEDLWDNTYPDTLSVVELELPNNEIYEALFVNGVPCDDIWNRYGSIETFLQQQLGIDTTQHHFEPIEIDREDMLTHKATEILMLARKEYARHKETVTGTPLTPGEFLTQECGLIAGDITDILNQVTPYDDQAMMQKYQINALTNFINGKNARKATRTIGPVGAAVYLLTLGIDGIAADCGDSSICAYDIDDDTNQTDLLNGGIYPIHHDGTDISVMIKVQPSNGYNNELATVEIVGPNDFRNTTQVGKLPEGGEIFKVDIPSLDESVGDYCIYTNTPRTDGWLTDKFSVADPCSAPPVPEASTITLLSTGLVVLGLSSYLTQNGFKRKKQD